MIEYDLQYDMFCAMDWLFASCIVVHFYVYDIEWELVLTLV